MTTTNNAPMLQPYLFFEGRCEEAIEFYRQAVGAEVNMIMRFKDSPDKAMCPPGNENKVMHASVRIGQSMVLASDGRCEHQASFQGFALSLTVSNEAEAEKLYAKLGAGGKTIMPLTKTFFSPRFGMLADKFGVMWMVYVAPQGQG